MTEQEQKIFLEWEFILRNISDFVLIAKINSIKFEVRTNEQCGHNKAHLHVSTSSASLSIAIEDGEILAQSGKISPSQIKQAKSWVEKNHDLVVSKWNSFSNGIEIQVN
ncbi:MAG: DUF4160 domain-containing protein [Bacilli bacterium]